MKNKTMWVIAAAIFTMITAFSMTASRSAVQAQEGANAFRRAPHCTNGTASGTYGYHMEGQIVGVGPFLVNGLFTHKTDGTMDADVQLVVGDQSFPAAGSGGTFKTNDDCTGTGMFRVEALGLDVTYNFIATDGGDQIELLNTNPGIVLHGVGRRIAKAGKAPNCNNGMIIGSSGYRLSGSLPGVPAIAGSGLVTHSVDGNFNGHITGTDTYSFMGQFVPRTFQGTYKLESNCRGKGFYTDSLGNNVNYVFTVVNGGNTIFLQGNDPGTAVSGISERIR
ncbi:MAG: hypothetical protein JST85_17935 [Acidobacteria bacterium]|nr:hypothetical protein [Acidobacteriota bacterium]